ncbi:hypothetical protein GIB67_000463 [Kingdonia uniflora]|uniref:Uncharacterized protein n=1 Tax=Kingdonia uniflora TaxID=39325 RepID=A0A7J7L0D9_9MAGN|nr:hypothetical protein GIB67_000463 [Kingdonia uniflora]
MFVKQVYETLRASPHWNEMLLIIPYDEHGGFYDHVPTPASGVPSLDDIVSPDPYNFTFDHLGVQVPTIMVSPWIERGTVVHGPKGPYPSSEYEHSSISAMVKKVFTLNEFLTKRDAWAGTFETVINRNTPRTNCPVTLPDTEKLRKEDKDEERALSEFQSELVQLAATLNGDHTKDIFPQKLIENMKVIDAVGYVEDAFKNFCDVCEEAKNNGADDFNIIDFATRLAQKDSHKSFDGKIFSCCICKN